MYKGAIFDLDMCILDTRSLGDRVIDPVLEVLHSSDLAPDTQKDIGKALWTTSLADVGKEFDIPTEIFAQMDFQYRNLRVPKDIHTFGDEDFLEQFPIPSILVTSGFKKFQQQKIDILNISHLFEEVVIDEIDDPKTRLGKTVIFSQLAQKRDWKHNEILVIGDNPKSELGAGQELGMTTVQTVRPTIQKWEEADHHVHSLKELESIIS